METPLVPFEGAQTWRPKNIAEEKHLSLSFATETKSFTPELRCIEINASSSASTVYLAKTKAITPLLASTSVSSGCHFHVTQLKSLECSITKGITLSSQNSVKHYVPL